MSSIIEICIPIYILYTFFYGIIVKFTINNNILFALKTIIPELLLTTIAVCGLLMIKNKPKIRNKYTLILCVYTILIFFINLFTKPELVAVFYVIRDIMIPVTVFCILTQAGITDESKSKIIDRIGKIFIIFVVLGFILSLIQSINGWEWSSKFYTGYSFYGTDPVSKIKIWEHGKLLRTPSVTGNSAIFGVYCLVSLIFILKTDIKYKTILIGLNMGSLFLSTSKTPLLIALFILLIDIISKYPKETRKKIYIVSLIVGTILVLLIIFIKPSLLFSLKERVRFWSQLNEKAGILNLIIPLKLFGITSAAEGVLSFMDNTYLYFMYATGIIGLVLMVLAILSFDKSTKNSNIIKYMMISFLIMSFFTNITQGRSYFTTYIVLMPILYSENGLKFGNKIDERRSINESLLYNFRNCIFWCRDSIRKISEK